MRLRRGSSAVAPLANFLCVLKPLYEIFALASGWPLMSKGISAGEMSGMGQPASHRWHRGFLRLYVVIAVPWLVGFGYVAQDAERQIKSTLEYLDLAEASERRGDVGPPVFDSSTLRNSLSEQQERRSFALRAFLAFPVGAPILYLIAMWVLAGFRLHKKTDEP
jgi:hypothetical protein